MWNSLEIGKSDFISKVKREVVSTQEEAFFYYLYYGLRSPVNKIEGFKCPISTQSQGRHLFLYYILQDRED